MRTAYFDCFQGANETMLLGALLDAGADPERLREDLAGLSDACSLSVTRDRDRGVAATRVTLKVKDDAIKREMREVAGIILKSNLATSVQERALRVFHRLALAHGRMLDQAPERVILHEAGSMTAIATVVAFILSLDQLSLTQLSCSALPLGSGTVKTPQGLMPVPAPVVVELLAGIPICDNGETGEQLTALAAAMLSTLCRDFGKMPAMRLASQGWGVGVGRQAPMCRVLTSAAEPVEAEQRETVGVVETNIDDANPQFHEYVVDRLFEAGALDVFLTPIVMKRGRSGIKLTALIAPEKQEAITDIIFAETPSIGVRTYQAERRMLDREIMSIKTDFGPIRVKVARQMGAITNLMPEYKDCVSAAKKQGVPLKTVWQATLSQALQQTGRAG
ncbi:nickel pincer cofactor biosynthesis protein LarC [bacterium]|nr:nickel pincer cofactor biosynthesis protein LarC [bacterium]